MGSSRGSTASCAGPRSGISHQGGEESTHETYYHRRRSGKVRLRGRLPPPGRVVQRRRVSRSRLLPTSAKPLQPPSCSRPAAPPITGPARSRPSATAFACCPRTTSSSTAAGMTPTQPMPRPSSKPLVRRRSNPCRQVHRTAGPHRPLLPPVPVACLLDRPHQLRLHGSRHMCLPPRTSPTLRQPTGWPGAPLACWHRLLTETNPTATANGVSGQIRQVHRAARLAPSVTGGRVARAENKTRP